MNQVKVPVMTPRGITMCDITTDGYVKLPDWMMSMTCTCAVADSPNVRVSDLIDPACPEHGCKLTKCLMRQRESMLGADQATFEEIKGVINESMREVSMGGRVYYMMDISEVHSCARNLLSRYNIQRKR